jgi:alanyl-tRNA synthetase
MTFLVGDGVLPGPGGREYVLRRIIRRAVRYGRRLGAEGPFLTNIVDAVLERMGPHYDELVQKRAYIHQVIETEEEAFGKTLRAGSAQIERLIAEARTRGETRIHGERVFDLYQTYGFPSELTEELLREEGLSFDRAEYQRALEQEQHRARTRAGFQEARHAAESEFGSLPRTEYLAWTHIQAGTRVLAVRPDRLVLEASPFYPEGGGQIGDAGWIRTPSGLFVVEDTRFDDAEHIVHLGHVQQGTIEEGEMAQAQVDAHRRDRTRRHHTATHLLHRALKDVLGEATSQQGSEVAPDALRFDFNAAQPVSRPQLDEVSRIVNERSLEDLSVHWEIMPIDRARESGAVMMFGEKYSDMVRVVSIGEYSRELCGGTHTHHSGELGAFVIGSEAGIGSGKRRIVAYAGHAALAFLAERVRLLESVGERVGAPTVDQTSARLDALLAELESTRRELQRLQQQQAHESAGALAARAMDVEGVKVVAGLVEKADRETLSRLIDTVREELRSGVVVLGTADNGRVQLMAGVSRDLTDRLKAGTLLNEVARIVGGKAGGPPNFAQGGGTQPAKLPEALESTRTIVARLLSEGGQR